MKEIPLTKGMVALVDDEDFELASQYKWYALKGKRTFYAASTQGGKAILLHRLILGTPDGMETDHRDGNGLNCQKYNIRICTHAQNSQGKKKRVNSGNPYKGIFRRQSGNWQVIV